MGAGFSGGTPDCVTTLQYQNVQENRLNTSVGATDSPFWPARDVMPEKRMIDGCTGEHKWRAKRQIGGYYYCAIFITLYICKIKLTKLTIPFVDNI